MKKILAFLLIFSLSFFACDNSDPPDDNPDTPVEPVKTRDDFNQWTDWLKYKYGHDTWTGWLQQKYGNDFGYDAVNGIGGLKEEITHNMLAEEYFFAKGLNAGWNLGNTYELNSNPRASSGNYNKVFPGIKAAGFNVIRIPCTWGGQTTNNVVSSSFLDQVEAAVQAAHAAGLVVFINTHHDKSYFDLKSAGNSLRDEGEGGIDFLRFTDRFENVWRQIAERFKDYGSWLIFESLNEPTITDDLGQTRWDGAPAIYHEVLNRWNQTFVETVRATGGNNAKRYLIFKSYAGKLQTSLDPTNNFKIPTDPVGPGRLVFSFHAYIPQPLGLEGQNTNWGPTFINQYNGAFNQVGDAYTEKGIPAFMGETGATFHSQRSGDDPEVANSSAQANRNRLLMLNALGFAARRLSVIPCLWDNGEATNGSQNGETFAMFRRKSAHDNNVNNWGLPIDHTKLAGGSNPDSSGGSAMNAGNAARNDPDFGKRTIEAFIDAINGRRPLGEPRMAVEE